MHDLSTTIVAVATPAGRGGVGCVRLSGSEATRIARVLFTPATVFESDRPIMRFGHMLDRSGQRLDHGYLVFFPAGRSFTGETTVELWAHGSPAVLAEIVAAAIAAGAVAAEPGEFTYRALRHGRIDATRAEAVRDLVEARTLFQARVAFAQTEGAVARRVVPLREAIEEWIARGEAAVEFVDEAETHLPRGALRQAIVEAIAACGGLLTGYSVGRLVREGAQVALVGRPNVGKSSLFNRLLERERAIVTEIAGTTRDTLEETLELDGIPVRLIDTAGLRDATEPAEREGVRRAHEALAEADLVIWVLDAARPAESGELQDLELAAPALSDARRVIALNKCDLPVADVPLLPGALRVSARSGVGIPALRDELRRRLLGTGTLEPSVITNARQANQVDQTRAALERALAALDAGISEEIVLEELRIARRHLDQIVGAFDVEELYERIFSTFCIGK